MELSIPVGDQASPREEGEAQVGRVVVLGGQEVAVSGLASRRDESVGGGASVLDRVVFILEQAPRVDDAAEEADVLPDRQLGGVLRGAEDEQLLEERIGRALVDEAQDSLPLEGHLGLGVEELGQALDLGLVGRFRDLHLQDQATEVGRGEGPEPVGPPFLRDLDLGEGVRIGTASEGLGKIGCQSPLGEARAAVGSLPDQFVRVEPSLGEACPGLVPPGADLGLECVGIFGGLGDGLAYRRRARDLGLALGLFGEGQPGVPWLEKEEAGASVQAPRGERDSIGRAIAGYDL